MPDRAARTWDSTQCDLRQFDHIEDENEWFAAVFSRFDGPEPADGDDEWYPGYEDDEPRSTCPQCEAWGACGYDEEGRAMIHTNPTIGRTL